VVPPEPENLPEEQQEEPISIVAAPPTTRSDLNSIQDELMSWLSELEQGVPSATPQQPKAAVPAKQVVTSTPQKRALPPTNPPAKTPSNPPSNPQLAQTPAKAPQTTQSGGAPVKSNPPAMAVKVFPGGTPLPLKSSQTAAPVKSNPPLKSSQITPAPLKSSQITSSPTPVKGTSSTQNSSPQSGSPVNAPAKKITPTVAPIAASTYQAIPKVVDPKTFLKYPYFNGKMSGNEADQALIDQPVGTFVMRYSSQPGYLAVSYMAEDGVTRSLIGYDHTGFWLDDEPEKFPTLDALVDSINHVLKTPLKSK